MRISCVPIMTWFWGTVTTAPLAFAADVNGVWTKTTSKDPKNVAIFYKESNDLRATGYSEIQGKRIVWYVVGEIEGNIWRCCYHHTLDTMPSGWEPGVMKLVLSRDGNTITGTATSISGRWSGKIIFKKLR